MSKKLVLIDGNSILYRAFFALPLLHNDKGVYTNAVYGFTTMLLKIIEEENPTHMLVAFDAGKTTFRHETFKEYKGGRQKTPPELSEQFPLTREVLTAFQIPHYELEMYEADDIIGTLSAQAEKDGYEVKIISGDKDLLQLVSDHITVDIPRKGVSNVESYNPDEVVETMGVPVDKVIDLMGLMGDKSDNIPGVPGVGPKTAVKLLSEHGTIEGIYKNIDKVTGKKLLENLTNHQEDALMSRELATIHRESPITITTDDTAYNGYDVENVYELFQELEFKSLLNRIQGDEKLDMNEELAAFEYEIIDGIKAADLPNEAAVHFEMIKENYHEATIEAVGIVTKDKAYVIETEKALASTDFINWLEDETKVKYVYDAKGTIVALKNRDINMRGITFDLLLAAYLLNPAEKHDTIPTIAKQMQILDIQYDEEVYGKGAKLHAPQLEQMAEHVARKTATIYEAKQPVMEGIETNAQHDLFVSLELPLAKILAEMEYTGIQVDEQTLIDMGKDLNERIETMEKEIHELAGKEFNVNSPKQLGVILFEDLGLPVIKKTKTGYSTAADVLEKLVGEHIIISTILTYRQIKKLHSTYIEGLLKVLHPETKKIHTRFNQALTQTGRLSSTEPNLQNIPTRLEEGRKIRQAFIPSEKDWVIFAADYSQIELRVLAHISQDERLMKAFKEDKDIHTQTAMDVFHVEADEVTSDMRRQAKAVNFGIVYGISDYGLSQNLGISRKEAQTFIDKYFEVYPGVKKYMDDIVQDAKQLGYVETLMKRRRYLPDISSRNFNLRSFAERTAMNTPIQGTAADIIKQAMIDLNEGLKKAKLAARVLLQVHDELILEAPKAELEKLSELVRDMMENTVDLDVPLKVDTTHGKNWFEAT